MHTLVSYIFGLFGATGICFAFGIWWRMIRPRKLEPERKAVTEIQAKPLDAESLRMEHQKGDRQFTARGQAAAQMMLRDLSHRQ